MKTVIAKMFGPRSYVSVGERKVVPRLRGNILVIFARGCSAGSEIQSKLKISIKKIKMRKKSTNPNQRET